MKCKCLNPVVAWRCGTRLCKDGLVSSNIVFSANEALEWFSSRFGSLGVKMMSENEFSMPCNKCAACKIRQRKDLSTRLTQEASCYERKTYITLTYDNEHLPLRSKAAEAATPEPARFNEAGCCPTLVVSHVQLFVKRLRRHLEYHKLAGKIRYFAVGEYGSKCGRPHYHILVFGWSPHDCVFLYKKGNIKYYRSPMLEKLWPNGFVTVEDVNSYACRYCARYVTKKFVTQRDLHSCQTPEFILRSCRNGGTGSPWFDKFGKHACELGYTTYRLGDFIVKSAVPKYYYNRLRKFYPDDWKRIKEGHLLWIKNHKTEFDGAWNELERAVERYLYETQNKMKDEPL